MIHGDFWKILVVEVYISIDKIGFTLGGGVVFHVL